MSLLNRGTYSYLPRSALRPGSDAAAGITSRRIQSDKHRCDRKRESRGVRKETNVEVETSLLGRPSKTKTSY